MRNKLEVIWFEESTQRSDQVINFLTTNWSEKEVFIFFADLKIFEEIVSNFQRFTLSRKLKLDIDVP